MPALLPVRRRPQTLLDQRFRLQTPLGRGGMSELWIAQHLGLRAEVVIKFISAELSGRPRAAERFAREAAAAANVNSPHVVKILDYGASSDGEPFIVMEKLEGCDLASYLWARRALPPASVARIVRQLAKALSKAHAARIVHRDIKPANVFLCDADGDLFVKLLDFGVAKTEGPEREAVTVSGVCVGTPSYMSPEQILGAKGVDFRSDLWSMGVLAFHCLTGRKPFDGETAGAVLLAIHTLALPKPSELMPSLPAAVDAWFERACAREPENRFASAIELSNALSTALGITTELLPVDAEEPSVADEPPASRTVSAVPAAEDVSLLPSTTTHNSPTSPTHSAVRRRSRPALAVAVVAAIALGGAAYASRGAPATPDHDAAPIARVSASASGPPDHASQNAMLPLATVQAEPQVVAEPKPSAIPRAKAATSRVIPGTRPDLPAAKVSSTPTRTPAAPTASAPADADTSPLYIMPDARR